MLTLFQIELESLKNESDVMSVERRSKVEASLNRKRRKADTLSALWIAGRLDMDLHSNFALTNPLPERQRMEANKETKKQLEEAKYALEVAQRDGQFDRASQLRYSTIPELERKLPNHDSDGSSPFGTDDSSPGLTIHDRVTSGDIARVVAKSTGESTCRWPVAGLIRLFCRHPSAEPVKGGKGEIDSDGRLAKNEGCRTRSRIGRR